MPDEERSSATGSAQYMPRSPDPTAASQAAVEHATDVFRRELSSAIILASRDMDALKSEFLAKMNGMDMDRARLWERAHELTGEFDAELTRFSTEVNRRDDASRERIEQRLTDLDSALKQADMTLSHRLNAEREFIMAQIEIISTRMNEKFSAVDGQFTASKIAVDAALTAQKEAVGEQNKANAAAIKVSEGNTKEQLTSLGQVSGANFNAQEDKITDARDRITVIESLTRGIRETTGEGRQDKVVAHGNTIAYIAIAAVLVSIISIIVSITLHH